MVTYMREGRGTTRYGKIRKEYNTTQNSPTSNSGRKGKEMRYMTSRPPHDQPRNFHGHDSRTGWINIPPTSSA